MSTMIDQPPVEHDALVRRVRTDRDAFAALYDRFYPRILRYCSRRLYSRSVSEDLTSDIFLTAATKIDTFRGQSEGEFSQWLYTIATNRINEYLRSFERRRRLLNDAAESRRIGSTDTHTDDSIDRLDWPAVYQAMLQLKPRDQALIGLRYMQDLPHDQIAAILNLKPGTVRVALSRAIEKLRDRFDTDQAASTKGAPQ
jgi:RNA polymerase sigma-70 factor (ECF subfamily)